MKHIGKMQNNGAKIAVVYRTLPGDSGNALVVGTNGLPDSWHDSLMNLIQDPSAQSANELADILAVRRFPDGQVMLNALHTGGYLKKVPTSGVLMTPTPTTSVVLSELNVIIAEQKGVTVDQLAITDGISKNPKAQTVTTIKNDEKKESAEESTDNLSPAQLRSKADALFKQAQSLRKQADALDPPKSKKKVEADVEVE